MSETDWEAIAEQLYDALVETANRPRIRAALEDRHQTEKGHQTLRNINAALAAYEAALTDGEVR